MSANIFLKTKNALTTLWQIPYNPKESGVCYRVANAFLVPKNVSAGIVLKNHEIWYPYWYGSDHFSKWPLPPGHLEPATGWPGQSLFMIKNARASPCKTIESKSKYRKKKFCVAKIGKKCCQKRVLPKSGVDKTGCCQNREGTVIEMGTLDP